MISMVTKNLEGFGEIQKPNWHKRKGHTIPTNCLNLLKDKKTCKYSKQDCWGIPFCLRYENKYKETTLIDFK